MKSHTRHILTTSIVLGVLAVGAGVFIWSGLYNIGADDPHWMPVRDRHSHWMQPLTRHQSALWRCLRANRPVTHFH